MTMLLVLALVTLAAAAFFVAEVATHPARLKAQSIKRATDYGVRRRQGTPMERLRFRDRVVTPMIGRLAAIPLRVNPKTSLDSVSSKLLAAGLSQRVTPMTFLAVKGAAMVGGGVLGMLFLASGSVAPALLFAPAFAAVGFMAPDSFLTFRTRSRREAIRAELPDALDLLAVSVEAGLGFDGAVTKLTEHMDGPLVDEFALTLGEMRIGEGRQSALKKMADRVPSPELGAFVRAVIQADQLGISLGRILRVQAADSRLRRQAAAEEKAMKAPIKMLFPTVMFIFPSMFLVILGPAMINLLKVLK